MDFIDRNIRLNKQLTFLYKFVFPPFWVFLIVFISPIVNGTAIFDHFITVFYRLWFAVFFAYPYLYVFTKHFRKIYGIYAIEYINDEKAASLVKTISVVFSFCGYFFLLLLLFANRIGICLLLALFHTILITLPMTIGLPDPYWDE